MTRAIFISLCALLFTISSFWWINLRPGRLRLTPVRVFSAYVQSSEAALRIPITLYNTGAKPLVVVDLRAELTSAGLTDLAPTKTFRSSVITNEGDLDDFPHPYVVPGRAVVTKFVEFKVSPAVMSTGEQLIARVSVLVDGQWRPLDPCIIRTDTIGDQDAYITYSNDHVHWPDGQEEKARKALGAVRSGIAIA